MLKILFVYCKTKDTVHGKNWIIARKQTNNVQRYFQPGIQWVETEKTWTDSQCAKKSEQRGITLDQCKALLGPSDLSGPNVFNYSPDNHKGLCGLKNCPLPAGIISNSSLATLGYFIRSLKIKPQVCAAPIHDS